MSDAPALVRRYYDEVLTGGRIEVLDELLAPGFVSHGGGGASADAAGYRVTVSAIHIHRVEGDRFAELWEEIDLLGLLRQLGALGG
jgi:hypothetical protein